MEEARACLGFAIECETLWKGAGVVLAGFVLFVGSVYVLLAAVFGRWMGYLVLMVGFSGWMILQSALWLFGFWSQGPETPTNLGPRGAEPAWLVLDAGLRAGSDRYDLFERYPGDPWREPTGETEEEAADLQSVQGAATSFLAEEANRELGLEPESAEAVTPTQFTVDTIRFATAPDGTRLAVVQAHFSGGGPLTTLSMYHDEGSVPRYSYMFLAGSVLLFAVHVPLLDRAERSRREFLTGGGAPPWYGPA
ncbi:MAG: hypothetical protein KatS3mg013_1161 [Actinomycetota bacterium]|jgi:hypothetical protein|nr:MAG: hypothetical protein KatS3mg013_1161 [Actinomycetota bacterium]